MRVLIALIGFTVAGALSVQAPVTKPAAGQAAPAGDPVNGKKIYVSYGCYQCHNYAANGGVAGARLAPHPLAFADFSRYVRRPTGEMPPYTAQVVTDKEIADIYTFLLTIPAPPTPGSIAILKR